MVIYDHIWLIYPISDNLVGESRVDFRAPGTDEIAEVQQLNGLFLRLIQEASVQGQAGLGLPPALRGDFAELDRSDLQRIAAAPRSLFALSLAPATEVAPVPGNPWEAARRAFALAALYGAWTAVRHSSAVARALYGLQPSSVRQLRVLRVADLVNHSVSVGAVACAFGGVPGMWQALLASPSEPLSRTLVLALITAHRGTQTMAYGRAARVSVAQ